MQQQLSVNASFIGKTIEAAISGSVDAAEEALDLFRDAVDDGQINVAAPEYRRLAEYIAECFRQYSQGEGIDRALRLDHPRPTGQPKGACKVNQDSYAALMILLTRRLGSANKAKGQILEREEDAAGKASVSRRTLDTIYSSYAPARTLDDALLITMLSPAHRKLFGNTLR